MYSTPCAMGDHQIPCLPRAYSPWYLACSYLSSFKLKPQETVSCGNVLRLTLDLLNSISSGW